MNKTFKVFYKHPEGNFKYIRTVTVSADSDIGLDECLGHVFYQMQGDVWSPHGQAREEIIALGVQHTSMSIGDVAMDVDEQKFYRVEKDFGWQEVPYPCA
jgi:hypothetical protein